MDCILMEFHHTYAKQEKTYHHPSILEPVLYILARVVNSTMYISKNIFITLNYYSFLYIFC